MRKYHVRFLEGKASARMPTYSTNVYYNTILENSGIGKPFKALIYKLDYILRCIRYGEVKRLFRSLKRRFRSNA